MHTQDIVETWRREAVQEGLEQGVKRGIEQGLERGIEQGLERGIEQGLEQGLKRGVAQSLVEVYEARFGSMPEDLRAVIEKTDDEPTLVSWLRLAGTRSADEIGAALRAFRAS